MAVLGPSPQTAQLLAQLSASNRGMAPRPVPMGPVNVGPAPGPSGFANRLALAQANQTPVAAPQFQDRRETGLEVAGDLAQELATGYVNQRQRERLAETEAEAVNQVAKAVKAGNPGALTAPDTLAAISSLDPRNPVVQLWQQAVEPVPPDPTTNLLTELQAAGIDPSSPEGRRAILEGRRGITINTGDSPPAIPPPPNLEQFGEDAQPEIDILEGTGASGAAARVFNPLGDILFGQLPAPEADRARRRLQRMRTAGAGILSTASGLVGRDSNQTREQFQALFPEAGSLGQGDIGALNSMIEARTLVAEILGDVQQEMQPELWATAGQKKRDSLTSSGVRMTTLLGQLDRMIQSAQQQGRSGLPNWRQFNADQAQDFLRSPDSNLLTLEELDELAALAGLQ